MNDNEFENEEEEIFTITVTNDEGEEMTLALINGKEIGGVKYFLATNEQEMDQDEAEAYILKDISENDDDDLVLTMVDDEDELAIVSQAFGVVNEEELDEEEPNDDEDDLFEDE